MDNIFQRMRGSTLKNFFQDGCWKEHFISVSVDLSCLSCDALHSCGERITGPALVKILTDQAFPPRLPANDVNCKVVVRMEDRIRSEMVSVFSNLFGGLFESGRRAPYWELYFGGEDFQRDSVRDWEWLQLAPKYWSEEFGVAREHF